MLEVPPVCVRKKKFSNPLLNMEVTTDTTLNTILLKALWRCKSDIHISKVRHGKQYKCYTCQLKVHSQKLLLKKKVKPLRNM